MIAMCGDQIVWPGGSLRLRRCYQALAIMDALVGADGGAIRYEQMIDILWGNDPEGGPLDAADRVRHIIRKLRKELEAAGAPAKIEATYSVGYRLVSRVSDNAEAA